MLKNLFGGRVVVPNLVISQHVLDKIAQAAALHLDDETGEALAGLVSPGEATGVPTVYVLDTIYPDDSAIRRSHTFQQGDTWQEQMFNWLYLNWETERNRKHGRKVDWRGRGQQADKWDVPLKHLGDWHKQPGSMVAPSGADMMTALEMLHDEERSFDFLLAPILTLEHPATVGRHEDVAVNFITLPHPFEEGLSMRVDFWYIDRRSRMFLPIHPTLYPQHKLPALAPRTWRLVNEDRYNAEIAQLEGDGLFSAAVWWDIDGKPPLEECLMVLRQGASKVLLVGTPWDYPAQPPIAYVAPFMRIGEGEVIYDVWERMWPQAERVRTPPGFTWTPETYLVDFIRAIEDHLGIRPAQQMPQAPPSASAAPASTGGSEGDSDDNDDGSARPNADDAASEETTS